MDTNIDKKGKLGDSEIVGPEEPIELGSKDS